MNSKGVFFWNTYNWPHIEHSFINIHSSLIFSNILIWINGNIDYIHSKNIRLFVNYKNILINTIDNGNYLFSIIPNNIWYKDGNRHG